MASRRSGDAHSCEWCLNLTHTHSPPNRISRTHMKNWEPLVSLPRLAIDKRKALSCLRIKFSSVGKRHGDTEQTECWPSVTWDGTGEEKGFIKKKKKRKKKRKREREHSFFCSPQFNHCLTISITAYSSAWIWSCPGMNYAFSDTVPGWVCVVLL